MHVRFRAFRPAAAAVLAFAALLAVQSSASAVFISSTADSYAVSSTLTTNTAGVIVSAAIAPAFAATSANPPGSTVSTGFGPAGIVYSSFPPLAVSTTGLILDTADTLAAPIDTATATSLVNGTSINVLGVVAITATVLSSTASSTDNPALGSTGSSVVTGLTLSVLGVNVPVVVSGAPNQTISLAAFGLAGATLVINEQSLTSGVNTTGITTNALDLTFAGSVVGLAALNGSVIIAHSATTLNARGVVPEPSTFALMGIATVSLGLNHLRTRGRKFARDAA